ncbi:MAG: hypothetical protein Q8P95_05530 [bacterium]|nr:hypothetical protein [bacterium]
MTPLPRLFLVRASEGVLIMMERNEWDEAPLSAIAHLAGGWQVVARILDHYSIFGNPNERSRLAGLMEGWGQKEPFDQIRFAVELLEKLPPLILRNGYDPVYFSLIALASEVLYGLREDQGVTGEERLTLVSDQEAQRVGHLVADLIGGWLIYDGIVETTKGLLDDDEEQAKLNEQVGVWEKEARPTEIVIRAAELLDGLMELDELLPSDEALLDLVVEVFFGAEVMRLANMDFPFRGNLAA